MVKLPYYTARFGFDSRFSKQSVALQNLENYLENQVELLLLNNVCLQRRLEAYCSLHAAERDKTYTTWYSAEKCGTNPKTDDNIKKKAIFYYEK